jgi:hypothetical protein
VYGWSDGTADMVVHVADMGAGVGRSLAIIAVSLATSAVYSVCANMMMKLMLDIVGREASLYLSREATVWRAAL